MARTNVNFHIITAVSSVWAIGALEGFVRCVCDHVVLEVLTFVPPGDNLATYRA